MLPLHSPISKAPHLPASQFSSSEIFYKITSGFLKTGINLRSLPPAHSRGAVTFCGLCCVLQPTCRQPVCSCNVIIKTEIEIHTKETSAYLLGLESMNGWKPSLLFQLRRQQFTMTQWAIELTKANDDVIIRK